MRADNDVAGLQPFVKLGFGMGGGEAVYFALNFGEILRRMRMVETVFAPFGIHVFHNAAEVFADFAVFYGVKRLVVS